MGAGYFVTHMINLEATKVGNKDPMREYFTKFLTIKNIQHQFVKIQNIFKNIPMAERKIGNKIKNDYGYSI